MPTESSDTLLDAAGETRLYRALRHQWLPVAYGSEVEEHPRAVRVLDEDLVVVRFADTVAVFADLCPHRGARVSLGWMDDGLVRCPYHGWAFDAEGACASIPANPAGPIPARARLRSFPAVEACGLVWVCLAEPATAALPELPESDDPTFRLTEVPTYDWGCGAHRRIENFVDLAHLPWVHEGVLGSRDDPVTPANQVTRNGARIAMAARFVELPNFKSTRATTGLEPARRGGEEGAEAGVVTDQRWLVHAPVTLWWRQALPGGRHFGVFLAALPMAADRCRTFTVLFRDFALDPAEDDAFIRFQLEVAEADRAVAESQRPHELPVDLTAELHLRDVDRMSVEYRRALRELADSVSESSLAQPRPVDRVDLDRVAP